MNISSPNRIITRILSPKGSAVDHTKYGADDAFQLQFENSTHDNTDFNGADESSLSIQKRTTNVNSLSMDQSNHESITDTFHSSNSTNASLKHDTLNASNSSLKSVVRRNMMMKMGSSSLSSSSSSFKTSQRSLNSSSSRLLDAVTKTVKNGLHTISAHTSSHSNRYQEMPCEELSCVIERSDEFTTIPINDETIQKGIIKLRSHRSDHTSGDSDDDQSFADDSSTDDNGSHSNDGKPLLAYTDTSMYCTTFKTFSDTNMDCIQLNVPISDSLHSTTIASMSESPTKSKCRNESADTRDMHYGSDHMSIQPFPIHAPTRVSPRTLRKFRYDGIFETSLHEFQPHLPIDECDSICQSNQSLSSPIGSTAKVNQRSRTVRGGRKPHQRARVDPKAVLNRMSFGPSSNHHYRFRGGKATNANLINHPNLSDYFNASDYGCDRLDVKLEQEERKFIDNVSSTVEQPKIHDSRLSTCSKTTGMAKKDTTLATAAAPNRERVKFDFNPRDLDGLAKAIEEAKISRSGLAHKYNTSKTSSTSITKPLVDGKYPVRQHRMTFMVPDV